MFPFFFFQTEATKESDMARYIHAPKEDEAARWSEVYTRFLPLTAIVWTEEQAAPMEDGTLPCILDLSVKAGNVRHTGAGAYMVVYFRDGEAVPLPPYRKSTVGQARHLAIAGELYDVAATLAGGK